MFHRPPVRRQLMPLSDGARREAEANAERYRAEHARQEELAAPFKAAVLASGGPILRNPEAALSCHCSCHPRPATFGTHDGGASCPCQQDPAERQRALDKFFRVSEELGDAQREAEEAAAAAFASVAEQLDVAARVVVFAAPFVISGVCDGRGFYLRERHGHWRVTIAPDDNPSTDPWTQDAHEPTYDIASGDVDDLTDPDGQFSPAEALRVAIDAVRNVLGRRACTHTTPIEPDHTYCARCGIQLADATRWTW